MLPSEPLSHLHLHAALEAAGALVVAEDDWWGARAPGADVALTEPPLEACCRKYWLDTPTANVYPAEAREAWFLAHAVATGDSTESCSISRRRTTSSAGTTRA